ncbi:hypothetical protein AAFF_G00193330 [Aldrovandia affinis]|uniref:Ig-like domain-containing protein n=1 Tax=Aldrovandia affinis TaxID=143900 RepID=A0AAD7WW43_9TELE|nr:hypothetical protein AAFF_G00193330 [Aldrovandia affinis]
MDLLRCRLRRITLLLCLKGLLLWDLCVGQRVVQIQEGPLYRVKGYPVTISCNVSGFHGSSQQTFEFSIFQTARPNVELKIISTAEANFAYALYSKRVKNGDIKIEQLTGSSVLFHINNLLEGDVGEYECYTPNTDGIYYGRYSAKTKLNVIQDTLSVSSRPDVLSKTEGESLQLECEVSSQTFQHTHLSVTWFLQSKGAGQPRPIISLTRDFTLSPGEGFEERYRSGLISLDKVQETTYRLSMSLLRVSDQGSIYCQASEWMQDPDRSWYRIAYNTTEVFTLQVQPIDTLTNLDSFNARIESPKEDLQEGDTLEIQCNVEAQNVLDSYFSVAWLKDDKEVAGIGPTGVPSIRPGYLSRESEGELKVVKKSDRDYLLTIRLVRTEDGGRYLCRVWKEEKNAGSFTRGQSQESSVKHVGITIKKSGLIVSTPSSNLKVTEGDVLRVTCRVSGASEQLSISWQHKDGQGTFNDVMSLGRNGVMEPGLRYRQRAETGEVRTLRATSDSFTLEIANALPSDSGDYKCTVSEWAKDNADKTNSKSQEVKAEILSVDSLLRAELRSRTMSVRENEEIEIFCKVKGPKFPLTVTWKFKHPASPSQEEIMSLMYDGTITWRKERPNYQFRTQVQRAEVSFILKVFRASAQEAGKYQCVVEAYLRQNQKALKLSNELAVAVRKPDSQLLISTSPPSPLKHSVGSDVQMECGILAVTANTSRFAVSWVFQPEGGKNQTVLRADRDSILAAGVGVGQKYSLSRRAAWSYQLLLQQAETGDSGRYYCLMEEWLQDAHGEWSPLAQTSATIQLIISPQKSNFSVLKGESKVKVQESEQVYLNCTLGPGSITPTSHYSVTWFFIPADSSDRVVLMKFSHSALLDYTGVNEELMKRMHFYRPALGSFSLTIQNMDTEDSGRYSCQVDEYQLDCEGKWLPRATDQSGVTTVTVHQTESNLHVLKHNDSVTVDDQLDSFVISCNITSYSSSGSVFEVTWWQRQVDGEGERHPIFRARHNFTLQHLDRTRDRMLFGRPQPTLYTLTLLDAKPSDSGQYYCHVEEWLLSPRNTWRKNAEDTSGYLTVSFRTKAGHHLSVLKPEVEVAVQEGQMLVIDCTLGPGSITPTSHYSVTWFFIPANSSDRVVLMKFSHNALLDYTGVNEELMKRMHFYRPALGSFSLTIQNMDTEDSGRYSCQVDEYQLDCEGKWLPRATDQSGVTTVSVHQTERDLHVLKHNDNITVDDQLGSFLISCNITSYSSGGSVFEVTWWQRQVDGEGKPHPIFRARRNFTLQHLDRTRDRMLFGRPQTTLYTLTLLDAKPSDSGQYYCHVEEWLLSPRNTWRKISEDTSGYLTVSFQTKAADNLPKPSHSSRTLPVTLTIIALLILVIGALSYKLWKAGNQSKKNQADTLWSENNPLKPRPEN